MAAYYNEIDCYAAQWLKNLISNGLIAEGDVDTRSIKDVTANDIKSYTQCHFFAGIGVWSYALRMAGWGDDQRVWTGSCPCQPFSTAGSGHGFSDARHLWPELFRLIKECNPPVLFGEQVKAAISHGWIDAVQDDMESIDYAFAATGIPAASVGAAHIRQRIFFVADKVFMADTNANGCVQGQQIRSVCKKHDPEYGSAKINPWSNPYWISCGDSRLRPVESKTERMVDGVADYLGFVRSGESYVLMPTCKQWNNENRIGRLKCYGNAIVPQVAAIFIESYIDSLSDFN